MPKKNVVAGFPVRTVTPKKPLGFQLMDITAGLLQTKADFPAQRLHRWKCAPVLARKTVQSPERKLCPRLQTRISAHTFRDEGPREHAIGTERLPDCERCLFLGVLAKGRKLGYTLSGCLVGRHSVDPFKICRAPF
jgi:hypothetical protein